MKTKSSKTKKHIPQLVERGFAIHQQLILLNEELKKIKESLKTEASAYPAEHLALLGKDSEGSQWIARGHGCKCRIVFPDPKAKTEFDPCTSDFLTIRSLAGDHLKTLFRKFTLFRPVDKKTFRGQETICWRRKPPSNCWKFVPVRPSPKQFSNRFPLLRSTRRPPAKSGYRHGFRTLSIHQPGEDAGSPQHRRDGLVSGLRRPRYSHYRVAGGLERVTLYLRKLRNLLAILLAMGLF